MSAISDSLLLVSGYIRELLLSCNIPIDVIREIINFFYELFPHLFAIKIIENRYYNYSAPVSKNSHEHYGIEYIDIQKRQSTHLNIFDINTNCFIKDMKNKWGTTDIALAIDHNFKIPAVLQQLLPTNVKTNYNSCTAIFKIGDHINSNEISSSIIAIDHDSIYSKHHMSSDIITNGYQFSITWPMKSISYYQMAYHASDSTLYAICNNSHSSLKTSLFRMTFKETEKNNESNDIHSALKWEKIAEEKMNTFIICDGSMICISNINKKNEHLMFVYSTKAHMFPLIENESWIEIKDSNFQKMRCGMCFDSIRNRMYAGCGYLHSYAYEKQMKIDVYDYHKNEWYADIIPEIDTDDKLRCRPKFWMQNNLLYIGGGGNINIPNFIVLDLRENNKQWKVFDNQWNEYFVTDNVEEEQHEYFKIETIL